MNIRRNSIRSSIQDEALEHLELPDLIQWAYQRGAMRQLRLFACWCARQTLSSDTKWEHAIELAEKFTRGEVDAVALEEERNRLRGIACAAGTTGHHYRCLNSYTMLTCFQTLQPNAAEAALYASQEHWMWCRVAEEKKDPALTNQKSRAFGEAVKRRQARELRRLLRGAINPLWGSPRV